MSSLTALTWGLAATLAANPGSLEIARSAPICVNRTLIAPPAFAIVRSTSLGKPLGWLKTTTQRFVSVVVRFSLVLEDSGWVGS
jgi:hypothetical protein